MPEIAPFFTRPVATLPDDAPLADIARRLAEGRFRHLPLVDGKGRVTGVATDADVLRAGRFSKTGVWVWSDASNTWMKARDVAIPPPPFVPRDLTLAAALDRMLKDPHRLLMTADDFKRPLGIFTERDAVRLAARALPADRPWVPSTTVPIVASPDERSGEVYKRMEQHHIRHLPVVAGGKVVGVVSRRDLLREDAFGLPHVKLVDLGAISPAVTAAVGLGARAVAERLLADRIGCLPLLDASGNLATVATSTDVARLLSSIS